MRQSLPLLSVIKAVRSTTLQDAGAIGRMPLKRGIENMNERFHFLRCSLCCAIGGTFLGDESQLLEAAQWLFRFWRAPPFLWRPAAFGLGGAFLRGLGGLSVAVGLRWRQSA